MATALSRSPLTSSNLPVAAADYAPKDYIQENLSLLKAVKGSEVRILFCAGRGGFSIGEEIALQQLSCLQQFCREIEEARHLVRKYIFISSLGCACSEHRCPYTVLAHAQEEFLLEHWRKRALIMRLPSMYGYNRVKKKYSGLIGVMMNNLKTRKATTIYTRLETRRNYLSSQQMAASLFSDPCRHYLDQSGIINLQAAVGLSAFDVSAAMFRAIRQRPSLRLSKHTLIDSESHYPSRLKDAKIIINDSLPAWIKTEWTRYAPRYPLSSPYMQGSKL
jgi:hypothetical protein